MRFHRNFLGATLSVAISALCLPAFAALPLPQPVHAGRITYVTGGIGQREQHALEGQARDYNLEITNANKAGEFTDGTELAIQPENGQTLLRITETGPLFYAKLPPGEYVIHAINGTQKRLRDIRVAVRGMTEIHLIWRQPG